MIYKSSFGPGSLAVIIRHFAEMDIEVLLTFNCTMCKRKSILNSVEDLFKLDVQLDLQVLDKNFDHRVNQSYKPDDKEKLQVIEV